VVTVVFCDLTGSTALGERLDPEALRHVLHRYYDAMAAVVERHGGTVEKFIGDAVMAVFGVPATHEDDPLRAVRAAAEMQREMATISDELERRHGAGLAARIGVNTGEVIAGDPSAGQRLVTGDAVNVAARLEQAAGSGDVLLGAATARLVRDAVVVEAIDPLSLKGKTDPVPAFRLVEVLSHALGGHERGLDSPLVGRDKELRLLRQALDRATTERTSQLFTLLGPAGVGKSRLVHEFLSTSTPDATVLRGRCLSYGEGITYYAIGEIVHQAAGVRDDDGPDEAFAKLTGILTDAADGDRVASLIAGILGWREPTTPEDAAWAIRKLLEHLASRRTVVVEVDDVHWAEPLLLDLIDHLADWTRDAPVLVVCVARPELLDIRPNWGGGKFNATSMLLEPLAGEDAERLIENLLGDETLPNAARDRILSAAEGNPLFVEEMVGMLVDDGLLRFVDGRWHAADDLADLTVPPTIQLLLAARLDRLDAEERAVIERGAVEGKIFHLGAVTSLSPEAVRSRVRPRLLALARKELIRPDRAEFAGEDAFRFRHLLIRDAAYHAMPKEHRAELHEAFADWLGSVATRGVESYDEILAHHLEQAFRYREELGIVDDRARRLGNRASRAMRLAAEQVAERGALSTAIELAERAIAIADGPDRDAGMVSLAEYRYDLGDLTGARDVADAVLAGGTAVEPPLRVRAAITSNLSRISTDPGVQIASQAQAEELVREAERTGDEEAIALSLLTRALTHFWSGDCTSARRIGERLLASAPTMRFSLRRSLAHIFASDIYFGPAPTSEGDAIIDVVREIMGDSVIGRVVALNARAALLALRDQTEEFDDAISEIDRTWEELGNPPYRLFNAQVRAESLRWQDRLEEAAAVLRDTKAVFDDAGESAFNATITALLAVVSFELGLLEDARRLVDEARTLTADDDFAAHVEAAWTRGLLAATGGRHDEARAIFDEAFERLGGTDYLCMRAETHRYRGDALALAGDAEGARAAYDEAFAIWARKGNAASARHLRERLA
jgi:class 3 adenylate cyclase/tetratricopeptide (TPR) repeat protein